MPRKKSTRFNPKKEVSVMAWIENDQGSVLLVRQTAGQKLWTLPGGKVKRGESLERALKREVREETGLSVRASEYVRMYDRPKRGAITILSRVLVQRQAVRMHFPAEEIADLVSLIACPQTRRPQPSFSGSRRTLTNGIGSRAPTSRRVRAGFARDPGIREALEAFKAAVESGKVTGFRDDGMRAHDS